MAAFKLLLRLVGATCMWNPLIEALGDAVCVINVRAAFV